MVPQAATVPAISYREAAELAHFGARVIHPSTIKPVSMLGIPVCVRNTGAPNGQSTRILPDVPGEGPKAIAFKKNITVVNVTSGRMLMAYGFLKAIFAIFEKFETSVDLVATSEVTVSMTIDDCKGLKPIVEELENLGSVSVESGRSIVCLVGQDLWKDPAIVSRVFRTLKNTPIRMISLGSSDTNLSLVVPQESTEKAVRSLHSEFFE
jgi:aspartate kinase